MHISVAWLNTYLDRPVTPDEAERVLTHAGFPIETRQERPGGDVMLDVEVTSNRGDVLSHLGCAREIAAATGRRFVPPVVKMPEAGAPVAESLSLANQQPRECPRFTAQVVRGVRIGPSPEWLRRSLEAIGQRPINNVVDVTNYLTFEYGQPMHVFDLDRLEGRALVVRYAREGEALKTLDGKARALRATDLVVADARRAQSLAGVIGGADSEVGGSTTSIVLQAATWDPVTIRGAARRLGIRTDASHRFERRVHPATIVEAARRAAAMIVEVAGGTISGGMLDAGAPLPAQRTVAMRTARCRAMLGYDLPDEKMLEILRALGMGASAAAGEIRCEVPPHRMDLEREIDLIEEVARIAGYERVPTLATLPVAVRSPQGTEILRRNVAATLNGLGFYETVTFSFIRPGDAADFLPPGMSRIDIDDARRGEEPTLRPSVIPSLLRCRRANQHGQVEQPGGVRLYEVGAVFAGTGAAHAEHRNLALLMDVAGAGRKRTPEDVQRAIRTLRGAIDQIVAAAGLAPTSIGAMPMSEDRKVHPACEGPASAGLTLAGTPLGYLALLSGAAQKRYDLDAPVVYAEIGLGVLENGTRPVRLVHPLPQFPAIDRDLSIVVGEGVRWAQVEGIVGAAALPMFESLRYVTTFRDEEKVGKGRKVVTLRIRFRAADRTLRSEEADSPVASLVSRLGSELGATLRT